MSHTIRSLQSVLLSVAVLLSGHGLQLTVLPLYARAEGWSADLIGLTGAAYFTGFIIGCLTVPLVIRRVGYIRFFPVGVALAVVSILGLSSVLEPVVWLLGRLVSGWCFAGLYLVVESWLVDAAPAKRRGTIMAVYGFVCFAAMAAAQALFAVLPGVDLAFVLIAALLALAIVPVCLTSAVEPAAPTTVTLDLRLLYRISQVAPVVAVLAGMVTGLAWSLGAVFADSQHAGSGPMFALFMLLGGACCQMPFGRLSDLMDRRYVMLAMALVGAAAMAAWPLLPGGIEFRLYAAAFVLGGIAMPLYPLCVAHASDYCDGQFVTVTSGILLTNAVGSVLGPLVYTGLAWFAIPVDFFELVGAFFLVMAGWTALRIRLYRVARPHFDPFEMVQRTTPALVELDPRTSPGEVEREPLEGEFGEHDPDPVPDPFVAPAPAPGR